MLTQRVVCFFQCFQMRPTIRIRFHKRKRSILHSKHFAKDKLSRQMLNKRHNHNHSNSHNLVCKLIWTRRIQVRIGNAAAHLVCVCALRVDSNFMAVFFSHYFKVNLPQSMAQNSANASGNPIQNMSAMSNPMGMNMNAHGAMMSTTTVMVCTIEIRLELTTIESILFKIFFIVRFTFFLINH